MVDVASVQRAMERSIRFVKSQQLPSGAWLAMEDFEPRTTSLHLVTLHFIERLPLVEARASARFLQTQQRPDGGFFAYPFAGRSDVCATALAWAALSVVDLEEQREVRARARRFIDDHGGLAAVRQRLTTHGDVTAVYLAMAGLFDPFELPDPRLEFLVVPGALDFLLTRMNAGVVQGMVFLGAVVRALRERRRPSPRWRRLLHRAEAEKGIAYIEGWLNPNGNNNGTTVQTDQAIATLVALGRTPESPTVASALSWFQKLKIQEGDTQRLRAFTNENWTTSLALRALLLAGVRRDDPCIENALDYLCSTQSRLPMPVVNLRRPGAHRTGGWGFEEDNLILPDTDDTGTVLSALGLALDRSAVSLDDARRRRVQAAVDDGLANLLDMQSDDGGWAGFVWNLGSKGPGPLFDKPVGMPSAFLDQLRLLIDPPLELKECPVEGLTGRVLQGLGQNGFGRNAPQVQQAARFLRERQCPDGSFWARWLVGYLAATSCVLSGLADCGWDMNEPWLRRAVDYLLRKQNADGGWGETPAAYEEPHAGHPSPSMPPLTGIVLTGLIDAGLGRHEAVARGIEYLLATQADDGSWPNDEWLQIYEPYQTYYAFYGDAWYRPLEALGKWRRAQRRPRDESARLLAPLSAPPPTFGPRTPGTWDPAALRRMRMKADPVADAVIGAVFRDGEDDALRRVMGTLVAADDPIPPGLPAAARAYFDDTVALPSWADPERIARGQRLFTRHGPLMAMGLFCSSLPQAYCAADGALVLTQTQGMTRHVRRRILETAQFVFDVCCEGDVPAPVGSGASEFERRGIRAAQKVRLMHATVRHFLLLKGEWASSDLGLPINQEDAAGTLMTFSVVLLDVLARMGVDVDARDAEAFLHLWKVVGHLLGIDPDLLPVDVRDGRALMEAIRTDQWKESAQGRLLAEDLLDCIAEWLNPFLPGDLFEATVPAALMRFVTPPRVHSLLALPKADLGEMVLGAGARLNDLIGDGEGKVGPAEHFLQWTSIRLMRAIISVQRQGKETAFRIPTSLVRAWTLDD